MAEEVARGGAEQTPEEPLPSLDELLHALGAARVAELVKSEPHIAREVFRGVRAKADNLSLPPTRAALARMLEQDIPFREKVRSAYEDAPRRGAACCAQDGSQAGRLAHGEGASPRDEAPDPLGAMNRAPTEFLAQRREELRALRQSVAEWKSRAAEAVRRTEDAEAAAAQEAGLRGEAEDRVARADAALAAARGSARDEAGARESAQAEARRLAAEVERLHVQLAHAHAAAGSAPLPLDTPADREFALAHLRRLVQVGVGDPARSLARRVLAADPVCSEAFAIYARACASAGKLGELDGWCANRARAAMDDGDVLAALDLLLRALGVGGMELARCRGEVVRVLERIGRDEPRVRSAAADVLAAAGGQAGEAVAAAGELVRERNPFVDLAALGLRPQLPGAASAFVPDLARDVSASEVVRAIDRGDVDLVGAVRRSNAEGLLRRLAATDPYYAAVVSDGPRVGVVVDASNVARASGGSAEIAPLLDVLAALRQARALPIMLVGDANLPYLIDDRDEWASLEERGLAIRSGPDRPADDVIVRLARERGLVVISNDTRLADASPGPSIRRVGFRLVEGTVVLEDDILGGTA